MLLGLLGIQAADVLQQVDLLGVHLLGLFPAAFQSSELLFELFLETFHLLVLVGKVLLLAAQLLFALLGLVLCTGNGPLAFAHILFVVLFQLKEFLLRLHDLFLLQCLRFQLSFLQDAYAAFLHGVVQHQVNYASANDHAG